jgi:macrolide transport system ATP-binding/permease protein
MLNDLRYGLRQLSSHPGFTAVAVVTLALGIGANTAVFSLVNGLLLKRVSGIHEPDRLVQLGRTEDGDGFDTFSHPDLADYREQAVPYVDIAMERLAPLHVGTGGASERVSGAVVSGNYFGVLGVRASLGRLLVPTDDDEPGGEPVAVLSHALWERRFGADSATVGRTITVNGHPYTVVGITEPAFRGAGNQFRPDVFMPMAMIDDAMPGRGRFVDDRGVMWLDALGRLKPGVTIEQASAALDGIATQLEERYPDTNEGRGIAVAAGIAMSPGTRGDVTDASKLLLAVVALVLLIACANVANLVLARGAARGREMAVRASLGASRGRIARQLIIESAVLAAMGGAAGLLIALWLDDPLSRLPALQLVVSTVDLAPDARVFGFTLLVALVATLAFGLPPALHAARADVMGVIKEGSDRGRGGSRLRHTLVAGQVATSVVLLVAAGLFIRTLQQAYAVPVGFDTERVLLASVDAELQGYDEPRGRAFCRDLVEGARALPGVEAASLALSVPLGFGGWDTRLFRGDQPAPADDDPGERTDRNAITTGYFETMGIPILAGRAFTEADQSERVVVVNEAVAEQFWPDQNPLGQMLRVGRSGEPWQVIGVARDAKYRTALEGRRLMVYQPYGLEEYWSRMTLHVRTAGAPMMLAGPVRELVSRLDPNLPVYAVSSLRERLDRSLGAEQSMAALVGSFAALALLLAAIGLYGSLSYAVSRRTRELGVRMAIGAAARDVRGLVLSQGMRLVTIGLVIGVLGAMGATRLIAGMLFGVQPTDPLTFVAVVLLLALVAMLACYVPARRATRIDPMEALRHE